VKVYNTGELAMSLIKKMGSVVYGGYELITNFSCILVILASHLVDDAKALEPLTTVHIKKLQYKISQLTLRYFGILIFVFCISH
jgi:hypothetical protein